MILSILGGAVVGASLASAFFIIHNRRLASGQIVGQVRAEPSEDSAKAHHWTESAKLEAALREHEDRVVLEHAEWVQAALVSRTHFEAIIAESSEQNPQNKFVASLRRVVEQVEELGAESLQGREALHLVKETNNTSEDVKAVSELFNKLGSLYESVSNCRSLNNAKNEVRSGVLLLYCYSVSMLLDGLEDSNPKIGDLKVTAGIENLGEIVKLIQVDPRYLEESLVVWSDRLSTDFVKVADNNAESPEWVRGLVRDVQSIAGNFKFNLGVSQQGAVLYR